MNTKSKYPKSKKTEIINLFITTKDNSQKIIAEKTNTSKGFVKTVLNEYLKKLNN